MNSPEVSIEDGRASDSAQEDVKTADVKAAAAEADGRPEAAPAVQSVAPTLAPQADKRDGAPPATAAESASSAAAKPAAVRPSVSLIPFIAAPRGEARPPSAAPFWRTAFDKRLRIGAAAAGLAVIGTVATAAISMKAAQEQSIVAQNSEAQNLADSVKALKAKVVALETARREDLADLRKVVTELKGSLAATRDSNAALAQVNVRADRLERDSVKREEVAELRKAMAELKNGVAAHDSSAALAQINARADRLEHETEARIDKLGERIDHDAAAHNADFTARLEKLEKKPAPVVAAVAPPPAAPAPTPPVLTKQPVALPPVAQSVSKETTGSIPPPRAPIHGWVVREVRGNVAILEGPYGFRQAGLGDALPGAGRVERIERRGAGWAVLTDQGIITGASGGGFYRAGGYGAFSDGYGPQDGEF